MKTLKIRLNNQKNHRLGQAWWYMPVVPFTWEVEIEESVVTHTKV
jgi:hypothetical protein